MELIEYYYADILLKESNQTLRKIFDESDDFSEKAKKRIVLDNRHIGTLTSEVPKGNGEGKFNEKQPNIPKDFRKIILRKSLKYLPDSRLVQLRTISQLLDQRILNAMNQMKISITPSRKIQDGKVQILDELPKVFKKLRKINIMKASCSRTTLRKWLREFESITEIELNGNQYKKSTDQSPFMLDVLKSNLQIVNLNLHFDPHIHDLKDLRKVVFKMINFKIAEEERAKKKKIGFYLENVESLKFIKCTLGDLDKSINDIFEDKVRASRKELIFIETVPPSATGLENLFDLEVLKLVNINNEKKITEYLELVTDIKELDISRNGLKKDFKYDRLKYLNIKKLNMSYNNLDAIKLELNSVEVLEIVECGIPYITCKKDIKDIIVGRKQNEELKGKHQSFGRFKNIMIDN